MNNNIIAYQKFTNNTILNSIRRVLINEIETYTLDDVYFHDFNSSIYNMEYIIQRLRLIPIIQEKLESYKGNYDIDKIVFECNVQAKDKWITITPEDLIPYHNNVKINNFKIINDDIYKNLPILIIPPNEQISFTCKLKKNSNTGYNKYCHAWYDDEKFYIESIGKCDDLKLAFKNAINYLQGQCRSIRLYILNKFKELPNPKIEMDFKNMSRSALNIIVYYYRELMMKCCAMTKWLNEGNNYKDFNDEYIDKLVQPTDFITAVIQPHITEDIYRVFIDVNMSLLNLVNIHDNEQVNKGKVYVTNVFNDFIKQHTKNFNDYRDIKNPIIMNFVHCIDYVIEELENWGK